MKRLVIVLGVLALLAGGLSVTLAATVGAQGKGPQPKTLVVDIGPLIFVSPDFSINLDRGLRTTSEFELLDIGGNIIGDYIFDAVSTEPAGTGGWYGSDHFHILGEGVIEGVSHGPPWQGAIIGGTGIFAGARGEYSGVGGHVTFTFENPPKSHSQD